MHSTTPYKTAVHRLSIGRMLSVAGGEVAFVALMALVFGRTHSAIWGSAALLAVVGTYGLAAPFAGMLGDRFDRRIVMVCSDAAGAEWCAGDSTHVARSCSASIVQSIQAQQPWMRGDFVCGPASHATPSEMIVASLPSGR
jgi:MFS family permease